MGKATLVVMAAGIGSRFGGGIKQLAPVGPNGEIIVDYSVHDAKEAGFDKVVFVIRKDLEEDFKDVIGKRIEKKIEVEYVFQELEDIPTEYQEKFSKRKKPWGTGQAILCCKNVIHEPFLVINADDYYGKQAYAEAFRELTSVNRNADGKMQISMVGFILKNTLSENGGVTRGLCQVNAEGMLKEIVETKNIIKVDEAFAEDGKGNKIPLETHVSMNMWGLYPPFFEILKKGFREFLETLTEEDVSTEYLLPIIIGGLLQENKIDVKVLESHDKWFGVTYKEDREYVIEEIRNLIKKGVYLGELC